MTVFTLKIDNDCYTGNKQLWFFKGFVIQLDKLRGQYRLYAFFAMDKIQVCTFQPQQQFPCTYNASSWCTLDLRHN